MGSDSRRALLAKAPVPARFHYDTPYGVPTRPDLIVNVSAQSHGAKTYIYFNGGRVLGLAPLPVQFDRPGRYRLTFWTPALHQHAAKMIEVTGRGRQWVSIDMRPGPELARRVTNSRRKKLALAG
jgi:hypothetical protein